MAQVMLYSPSVMAIICQLESAGVTKHVRLDEEQHYRLFYNTRYAIGRLIQEAGG